MKTLRGKRVLVTVPELKKSAIEISAKDEEMIMQEASDRDWETYIWSFILNFWNFFSN